MEHTTQNASAVKQHFQQKHRGEKVLPKITFNVIGSGYFDSRHRLAAEAATIARENPAMNAVKRQENV